MQLELTALKDASAFSASALRLLHSDGMEQQLFLQKEPHNYVVDLSIAPAPQLEIGAQFSHGLHHRECSPYSAYAAEAHIQQELNFPEADLVELDECWDFCYQDDH